MRGFGHVAFVLGAIFATVAILWGETVGIAHAFRAHGADAGWEAVLVPPIAWWRGYEYFVHSDDELAAGGPEAEEAKPDAAGASPIEAPAAEPTPRPKARAAAPAASPMATGVGARPTVSPREVTRPAPPLVRRAPSDERAIPSTELVVEVATSLHEAPSADAPVVTRLRAGTVVTAVAESGDWLRIRSRSNRPDGWIRRDDVRGGGR